MKETISPSLHAQNVTHIAKNYYLYGLKALKYKKDKA